MVRSLVMDPKWKKTCFDVLMQDLVDAQEARAEWWQDYVRSHENYRAIPPGAKNFPWVNCSNLIPPMTTNLVEDTVRRIVMYFVQNREYITLTGLKKSVDMLGAAKRVQTLLRWQGDVELDYLGFADAYVREFVTGGTAFGVTDWIHEETVVADSLVLGRDRLVQTRPAAPPDYVRVGEPARRKAPIQTIFNEIFASQGFKHGVHKKLGSSSKAVDRYRVDYTDEKKRPKKALVTIDRSEHLGDEIEVVAEMLRTVKNQPTIRAMPAERVLVPPGDHTVHTAPLVGIKGWERWDVFKRKRAKGIYDVSDGEMAQLEQQFEGKDAQLDTRIDRGGEDHADWEHLAADRQDAYLGVDSRRFLRRKIPIITCFLKYPIIASGEHKDRTPEAAITVLPKQGIVCRVQHATLDHKAGVCKRPLVSHNFVRSRNEFYGASLPRLLEPLQEEMNAVRNMQIDALNVTTNPIVFVDHTAAFSRDNANYHPAAVIKVSNPGQNVMIPQWPSRLGEFGAQIGQLQAEAQALANQSPSPPEISGSNRTARGAQMIITERNFNVVYDARMCGRSIEDLWQQVHSWNAAQMSPEKEIAIFGTDETAQPFVIRREEVRGEYMFRFEAGSAVLNDAMRRDLFTEWFQLIAPIAQAPSEQVPLPLWRAAVKLGQDRGIKDAELYLPEALEQFGIPLSPDVEHEIFMMGRPVTVHPKDVDALHVQAHLRFMMTPMLAKLPPEVQEAFAQHVLLHQRRVASANMAQQGAGQASIGDTGVTLGGRLALQGNPLVNAGQGQPASVQPQAPGSSVSVLG